MNTVAAFPVRQVSRKWKPYPACKDSGIQWLGEIPAHWEVRRLKYATVVGPSKTEIDSIDPNTYVSFLPMECISEDGSLSLATTCRISSVRNGYTYFRNGDVIIAKITPCFENGKGALCKGLTNGIGFGTTEVYVLRPGGRADGRFLFYVTKSHPFRKLGELCMYGSAGQQRVPEWFVKDYRLSLPPLPEQRAIAAFLDRETEKIDALIGKIQQHIDTLREYRTALISAAVTGQIDVREEAVDHRPVVAASDELKHSHTANVFFKRQVLAAEIVSRHQDTSRFGRVKLQKALILAEYHLGLDDIDSEPIRAAAGPFDNRMMRSIDKQLEKQQWYKPVKNQKSGCVYQPMGKCGEHRKYFDRYWGHQRDAFDRLIELLKPLKTHEAEIVATLYMAWNDFLILGQDFDDSRLIDEVRTNWDTAKAKYPPETWQFWLDWMRKEDLVPRGYGKMTRRRKQEMVERGSTNNGRYQRERP